MLTETDIDEIDARLLKALRAKLSVRGRSLSKAMKRTGRRLPREAHRAAAVLIDARRDVANPKLARRIDPASLSAAEKTMMWHLGKIDPKERRKDFWLSFAGTQALNVLGIIALVVVLLAWRGLI